MIVIENNKYFVKLDLQGGQINRFRDKLLDLEYIHDANLDYWGYSTPTLFPIIGSSYNKKYHFNGQETTMPNHGILRDARFNLVSHKGDEVVLRFESNSDTLEMYPYYFTIEIKYTLNDNKLLVEYEISNDGVMTMPFNFGLHPAIVCPIDKTKKFEDYSITFSSPIKLKGDGPRTNEGLISEIPLDRDLFKKYPTWLYHNITASHVGITDGKHGVNVSTVGFPVTAIWTRRDTEVPFVCIEPWLGVSTKIEKDLPFSERDSVMSIKENKKLLITYSIDVY